MGKALIVVLAVAILVYAFFDLVATPRWKVKGLPKWAWFVVVVLVPVLGPLAWIFLGTYAEPKPGNGGTGRVRPPRPTGPDDDPDYLRNL